MTALKPCPFCGGDAKSRNTICDSCGRGDISVECLGCGIIIVDQEGMSAECFWNRRTRLIGEGWINPAMVGADSV